MMLTTNAYQIWLIVGKTMMMLYLFVLIVALAVRRAHNKMEFNNFAPQNILGANLKLGAHTAALYAVESNEWNVAGIQSITVNHPLNWVSRNVLSRTRLTRWKADLRHIHVYTALNSHDTHTHVCMCVAIATSIQCNKGNVPDNGLPTTN